MLPWDIVGVLAFWFCLSCPCNSFCYLLSWGRNRSHEMRSFCQDAVSFLGSSLRLFACYVGGEPSRTRCVSLRNHKPGLQMVCFRRNSDEADRPTCQQPINRTTNKGTARLTPRALVERSCAPRTRLSLKLFVHRSTGGPTFDVDEPADRKQMCITSPLPQTQCDGLFIACLARKKTLCLQTWQGV